MKVLVTGGAGFLGRHIVHALRREGHAVRSFQRSAAGDLAAAGVEIHRGDIADSGAVSRAVEGCEAVFHVAALAGIWGKRSTFESINVEGTRHVLEACREHGVQRLVYTSTPSVAFNGEAIEGGDESLPYATRWLAAYPETKAMAEAEVLAADSPGSLRTVALRPHLIWGPGDNHLIPRLVERARAKRLGIVGEGDNWVDLTHVRNAAHAHLRAFDVLPGGACAGRAYFISDGTPVRLWDWIMELLERLELPLPTRKVPFRKAWRIGAGLEKLWQALPLPGEPPMTRFVAEQLAKSHYFDIRAAEHDLGYRRVVEPAAGLDELVEHLRGTFPAPDAEETSPA